MKRNTTTTKSRKNASKVNSMFEALEDRRLMTAAAPTVVAPIVVNGTNGNDVITVNYGISQVFQQATAKAAVAKAATSNAVIAKAAATTTKALIGGQIGTIFQQLTVTVNGVVTTTTTLAAGQQVQINGLNGNDKITVTGAVSTIINGGFGNDSLYGGSANDQIMGDFGDDFIDGGLGSDVMMGGAGFDTVDYSGRTAAVTVSLDGVANDGAANEKDNVGSDVEVVNGGWGNDWLEAGSNDTVGRTFNGNGGNDSLWGGNGNDFLNGGAGNDLIISGGGNDVAHGGAGNDLVDGGNGNDVVFADSGDDQLFGSDGNDVLHGGTGSDDVYGGDRDDTLITLGGTHTDRLHGGNGTDTFWLDAEPTEVIVDATSFENAFNVHRVASFDTLHANGVTQTPSRELNAGNLLDPTTTFIDDKNHAAGRFGYANFKDHSLFGTSGSPVVTDENQGYLGDCYFMAALEATAKINPNFIKQSVVDLGDGTYIVQFKQDGHSHFLRVDADLPVDSSGNLVYAYWNNGGQNLWAPIMEKAFAFFRQGDGNYASIESGTAIESFNALGLTNNDYYHPTHFLGIGSENPTEFGNHLKQLLNLGDEVTLCTIDNKNDALVENHCYMVDHLVFSGTKVSAVVLRNPWGNDGGKSADSVNDGFVTVAIDKALGACDTIQFAHA